MEGTFREVVDFLKRDDMTKGNLFNMSQFMYLKLNVLYHFDL